MPSLYTHNKFGKLVIPELTPDLKEIIKKYPNCFRIGLQGPDFLFFYKALYKNKVNQYGVKLHHSDVYPFLQNALSVINKCGVDSPEFSYMLGFICHFTLDNACHPYVNISMKQTGCGHVEIEGDLEHLLIEEDGFSPAKYPVYKLVPTDSLTADTISHLYDINADTARQCLCWMKMIKHVFVAPHAPKYCVLKLLSKASLHSKSFKGHIIEKHENKKCRENTTYLTLLFDLAIPVAVSNIYDFCRAISNPESLPDDFHCDFNRNHYDA